MRVMVAARMPKSRPKKPKIHGCLISTPMTRKRAKVPSRASSIHQPMTGSAFLEAL